MFRRFSLAALGLLLAACSPAPTPAVTLSSTYNPFVPLEGTALAAASDATLPPPPTHTPGPTPTRAPLSVTLSPLRDLNAPMVTPTPDLRRVLPTPRADADQYVVQAGDTLGSIAQRYGIGVEALMQANNLTNPNLLAIGQTLNIPTPEPGETGTSFKIIPDSELVYGPASAQFDLEAFIQSKGGYLSGYTQDVNDETWTGAQIITRVAQNYSVNPRLLLALLEYQAGWVTNADPNPSTLEYPLGLIDDYHSGLYLQLTWAANELNRGYYLWRVNAVSSWVLSDGSVVPVDATINAGTAGVQNLFAQLDDRPHWDQDVAAPGLFQTYYFLFGNPFDLAIEPLLPPGLRQPRMDLPFERGETWAFTGGPHGGWDSGSAWAALDFAPPLEIAGCTPSDLWVTAVADGLIIRAADGAVIQDLDGDGYEQTGWVVFYMHIEARDRVEAGTYLFAGDRLGHPSCEGGLANGTHVHLARRYNGEWIAADGPIPFVLDGWISSGDGVEYDGYLKRAGKTLEAWDGINELNQITR